MSSIKASQSDILNNSQQSIGRNYGIHFFFQIIENNNSNYFALLLTEGIIFLIVDRKNGA